MQQRQTQPLAPARVSRERRAPASVERVLAQPGSALPSDLRTEASSRLGFDFSTVQVHADADAGASAHELSFRAYAVRPHIVVAPENYRPHTAQGRALLLHELAHIKQQAVFEPGRPLRINESPAHEHNANQIWRGQTRTSMPMAANVLAGDSDSVTEKDVRAAFLTASHAVFGNGLSFRRIDDKTVEVIFEPKREGQLIILDADDPADLQPEGRRRIQPAPGDLPKVRLPNGELAVQRETKKLVAYNTRVVATFPADNIRFNEQNQPIGIVKYKPIEVSATTTNDGSLVQTESNITRIGKSNTEGTDVDDVRLQKKINTRKEYRGEYSFTKKPGILSGGGQRRELEKPEPDSYEFNKLEKARIKGSRVDDTTTEVEDLRSQKKYFSETHKEFEGENTSYKGKAKPKAEGGASHYVLAGTSEGATTQDGTKREVHNLRSGRGLVVETSEGKRSQLTLDAKDLVNEQGIENQPFDQTEKRNKKGREQGLKKVVSTVYQYVPVRVKQPDGSKRLEYQKQIVQQNTARTFNFATGSLKQQNDESPDVDLNRANEGNQSKEEKSRLLGANATGSASVDRASGFRGYNLAAAANAGAEKKSKATKAPEVPGSVAAPVGGRADLAHVSLAKDETKSADGKTKAGYDLSASLTDSNVSVDLKTNASYGYEKHDVDPDDPRDAAKVERSTLFGIFTLEQMRGATTLAGALYEGKASLNAQRGSRGSVVGAAQASLALSGNVQVGYYDEQRSRIRIKPDPGKINSEPVRLIVQSIDPVLDMTFNYHTFLGLEAKADVNLAAGGDSGNARSVGASGFVGGRAGIGIEGKLEAGRPLYSSAPGSKSGSTLGSLKGDLDATLGFGAAWKSTSSVIDGQLIIGGEGALSGLIGGKLSARAEFDLYKLVNVGIAVAKNYKAIGRSLGNAVVTAYRHDERARAAINRGEHKKLGVSDRVLLIETLFSGHTGAADQAAIVTVLEDAKSRGDLDLLVRLLGDLRLRYNLDGAYNTRYHQLVGS